MHRLNPAAATTGWWSVIGNLLECSPSAVYHRIPYKFEKQIWANINGESEVNQHNSEPCQHTHYCCRTTGIWYRWPAENMQCVRAEAVTIPSSQLCDSDSLLPLSLPPIIDTEQCNPTFIKSRYFSVLGISLVYKLHVKSSNNGPRINDVVFLVEKVSYRGNPSLQIWVGLKPW